MWAKVEGASITELIPRPKSMTLGDIQYPHNIFELWSASELEAIGIYPVVMDTTNRKDPKYYTNTNVTYAVVGNEVKGTYGTAVAQDLASLKTTKKSAINNNANSLLQNYDWYTLREASGGTATPSAVTTYQAAVRTKANGMCTQIDGVADVDALAALYVYSGDPATKPLGEWPSKPE